MMDKETVETLLRRVELLRILHDEKLAKRFLTPTFLAAACVEKF